METIEYKGHKITIDQDEIPCDPRERDNLGTMICNHGNYDLGDKTLPYGGVFLQTDLLDYLGVTDAELMKDYIYLPLYLYDHSGISIHTGNNNWWGDGLDIGYIFVSREDARKWYNVKKLNTNKVIEDLEAEVKIYNQYLTGQMYMFKTSIGDGRSSGYFSENEAIGEAQKEIDYEMEVILEKHIQYIKRCIKNGVNILYRKSLQN